VLVYHGRGGVCDLRHLAELCHRGEEGEQDADDHTHRDHDFLERPVLQLVLACVDVVVEELLLNHVAERRTLQTLGRGLAVDLARVVVQVFDLDHHNGHH